MIDALSIFILLVACASAFGLLITWFSRPTLRQVGFVICLALLNITAIYALVFLGYKADRIEASDPAFATTLEVGGGILSLVFEPFSHLIDSVVELPLPLLIVLNAGLWAASLYFLFRVVYLMITGKTEQTGFRQHRDSASDLM